MVGEGGLKFKKLRRLFLFQANIRRAAVCLVIKKLLIITSAPDAICSDVAAAVGTAAITAAKFVDHHSCSGPRTSQTTGVF